MAKSENLPVLHSREVPNCREAKSEDEAIAISDYHDEKVVALGNREREEWLIAPNAYSLDFMR